MDLSQFGRLAVYEGINGQAKKEMSHPTAKENAKPPASEIA